MQMAALGCRNSRQWRKRRTGVRRLQFHQVFAEDLSQHLGRGFELVAGHLFGHFIRGVQCVFRTIDGRHFQHDIRLNVVGRYTFALVEHGAELELSHGVALE